MVELKKGGWGHGTAFHFFPPRGCFNKGGKRLHSFLLQYFHPSPCSPPAVTCLLSVGCCWELENKTEKQRLHVATLPAVPCAVSQPASCAVRGVAAPSLQLKADVPLQSYVPHGSADACEERENNKEFSCSHSFLFGRGTI